MRRGRAPLLTRVLRISLFANSEVVTEDAIECIQHRNCGCASRIARGGHASDETLRLVTCTIQCNDHQLCIESFDLLHAHELDVEIFIEDALERVERGGSGCAQLDEITALTHRLAHRGFPVPLELDSDAHGTAFDDAIGTSELDAFARVEIREELNADRARLDTGGRDRLIDLDLQCR